MAFCSALSSAQNTFPAGRCTTVPLTENIPAQWLWLTSQLGSVSHRRECFSLFSALLFLLLIGTSCCPWGNPWATAHCCEWCQHIFGRVVISTLSKQVSEKSFLRYTVICLVDIPFPLPPLLLDGVAEFFLQFKQANYVNYCLLTPIKAYSCLEEETVHSLLLSQYQQVEEDLNGSPVFHCSWRVGLGGERQERCICCSSLH